MRYLGGKYRIAKQLRDAMEPYLSKHGHRVWEPMCGGLNFSRVLDGCTGTLSDNHPALISLYLAYRAGWEPPSLVTAEMHEAAKSLPDSDPLKAFVGFGNSFGGMYFSSYVEDIVDRTKTPRGHAPIMIRNHSSKATAASLQILRTTLSRFRVERRDFLSVRPRPIRSLIYCDPPYAGTTGYGSVFDHRKFWMRAQEWARYTTVLVSEYKCPVRSETVWERSRNRALSRIAANDNGAPVERLFRVLPPEQTVFAFAVCLGRCGT